MSMVATDARSTPQTNPPPTADVATVQNLIDINGDGRAGFSVS